MINQGKQSQAIFPDLPRETNAVDKDGKFVMDWSLAFSQLFQALQANFKNEGVLFPSLTAAQIATIQGLYAPYIGHPLPNNVNVPDISGQTVFDSTNRVPKVFIITYDGSAPPNVLTASWKTYSLI